LSSNALVVKLVDTQDLNESSLKLLFSLVIQKRLINEGIIKPVCEICNISEWLNKPIPLELHHIDGNRHNHFLGNLKLLCPNCHSQTDTFRAKNKKI
jgi:hypothetical protein